MVMVSPSARIASTWAGHWSIRTTSRPASIRLAAMQLPLAPVPSTAIFCDIAVPYRSSELEQTRGIAAEDHLALACGQFGQLIDGRDWRHVAHVGREIGAADHAVGADQANEIEQDVAVVRDGVVVETALVLHRRPRQVLDLLADRGAMGHAAEQPRERATGVRQH